MLPVLPPELVDETIDHLWDDHKALRACGLTCRSWVPSSRLHLFRTIQLRTAEDCIKLSTLVQTSPIISHCIRKLAIDPEYKVDEDGRSAEDSSWINEAANLLSKLNRVHTLALSRMNWGSLSPWTKNAFSGVLTSAKSLFLFEVRFETSGDVLQFLSRFPTLSELYFHGVSWDRETSTQEFLHDGCDKQRMDLTYLFLDAKSSPTLVTDWLLGHPSEKKLRTIQLCWRDMENTCKLGALLQSTGSELECLRVEFPAGLSEQG